MVEYEVYFFDFDEKKIRNQLKKLKAKQIHKMVPYQISYFLLCGEKRFK